MSDTHCAACDVGLPVGSQQDTCTECRQPFCASCIVLKSKLQKTSAVGRKNKCMCQQFISSKLPKRGQNRSPVRSTPHRSQDDELPKERTRNDCLSTVKGSQQKGISTDSPLKNKNLNKITAKSVTCEGNTSVYVKNGPVTEHEDASNEDRNVRSETEDEESKDAVLIEERDRRFEREDQKVDDRAVALPRPRPTRKRTDVSSSHDASTDPEELLEAFMPFFAQMLRSTHSTQRSRRPTTEDDFASLMEGLSPPLGEYDDEVMRMFPMVYQMLGGFPRPPPRSVEGQSPPVGESSEEVMRMVQMLYPMLGGGHSPPPRPVEGLSPPVGKSSEEVMRMVPLLYQILGVGHRLPSRPRDQPCPGCPFCDKVKSRMNTMTNSDPIPPARMRSFPPVGESVRRSLCKIEDEMCDITNENVDDIPPYGQLSQELIANGGYDKKFLKIATYKQIQKDMLEENENRHIMADVLLDDILAKRAAERPQLLGAAETDTNRSKASVDSSEIPEEHTVRENASLLPIETDVSDTKLVSSEPSSALENDKDEMDTGVMLKQPKARDNSTLFPNEKGDEERNQVPNTSVSAVENNDEMDKDLMRRQRLKRFETKPAFVEPQNKPDNRDIAPNMHSAPRTIKKRVLKPVLPIAINGQSQNLLQNGHTSTLSDVKDSVDVNDQTYRGGSKAPPRLNQNQDSSKIETTVGDQTTSPRIKVCDTDAGSGELPEFEDDNILDEKDIPTAMKAYLISQGKWNPNRDRDVVSRKTPTLNKKHTQPATRLPPRVGMTRPTTSVDRGLSQSDTPRRKQGQLGQSGSEDQSYRSDARHNTSGTSSQMHQLAEIYDRAFKSLKALESNKQTCPACSSPDCRNVLGFSKNTLQDQARINGLEVVDVLPDGNCMFAAVVDQLQAHGKHEYTTWSLRQKAVQWLKDNPKCPDDQDTHFQAFMSEPWETYLERMAQDGQWGDHVTIRAITHVVGCTVKILNVNGKTSNWTMIEPGTETKAVIILGHIGEFHYTSLRQAARQLTSSALGKDIDVDKQSKPVAPDLLNVKRVVLFKKDHVDRPSGLPICCWNFAIKIDSNTASTYICYNWVCCSRHIYATPLPRRFIGREFVQLDTFVPANCF
ncbi:uncharacterized protein LOC127882352 isoform X2 [Dreissena polymorpha]|uniref:uncharacterized protein LOC127882352 isoform X2 n=1 Tax=Dreissena polymorpha TaxID=45954 RepID=UPI0022652370|nr:uncharacterized protein LOC127882352 isoform X2 [Dreissena polymorpha]